MMRKQHAFFLWGITARISMPYRNAVYVSVHCIWVRNRDTLIDKGNLHSKGF